MNEAGIIGFAEIFLKEPYKEFYLREIAKKAKISVFAAKKYADSLVEQKILLEERRANLRYFKANLSSRAVKLIKSSLGVYEIEKSGLIEYIKEKIENLSAIVLFGSVAKGEDALNSDIDLLIVGSEKIVNLSEFEKRLKRDINAHVFNWAGWNKQLKSNTAFYNDVVIYGISLYGELPIAHGSKYN
jgi:predicted nucleotidyltransferase